MIKKRIAGLLAAVLLGGAIGAVALVGPAHAGVYYHRLINSSGLCLEARSPDLGTQLQLGVCAPVGTPNQMFAFTDAGLFAYTYYLQPVSSWWCLQPGAPSIPRSTVIQWYCNSTYEQIWEITTPNRTTDPSEWRVLWNQYNAGCLAAVYGYTGEYVIVLPYSSCGSGGGAGFWKVA